MANVLYFIGAVLIIVWLISVIGFQANGLIHLLLLIGVFCVFMRIAIGRLI